MSNLALYRKYRPQFFSEVVGQEQTVKTLTNALSLGLISHAYIFSGPRGSGKTTIARLLAKALNCHNRKDGLFEPCGKCESCEEIKEGRSLDLIEIDAASHRGIDEIRELRDGIKFAPAKEKYKVFIIDESHQLTKEASNALLKTLEEPPSHAIFILATTESHKMIPTILSRCQKFDFKKLSLGEITKKLETISKAEGVKMEKEALELIALNSSGAARDAESLLEQIFAFVAGDEKKKNITAEDVKNLLGLMDNDLVLGLAKLVLAKKREEAINLLEETLDKGFDPQELAKALVKYFRQVLLLKINSGLMNPIMIGLTEEEQGKARKENEMFKAEEIQKALIIFSEAESRIKYSSIPQLPLELAVVEVSEIGEKIAEKK